MGLFSEVINSCETLGPEFIGTLQTKDLESVMDTYWLDPDGQLYLVNTDSTWTIAEDLEEIQGTGLLGFKTVPTGKKGRLQPYRIYGKVRFTDGHKEVVAWFQDGILDRVLCSGPMFSCERVDMGRHPS